jgi:hypothetical protein
MSVGQFVSLEEVRHDPQLLRRFIRERVLGGNGRGDPDRFARTLDFMIKNPEPVSRKAFPGSVRARNAVRPGRDAAKIVSGKRERA